MKAASAGVDLEKVKRNVLAVIPGGATCDPQAVADDIRAVFCVFESEARKAFAGPSGGEVSEVTRLLVERDAAGRKKYGTTLDRTDLSHADWLQHMAEELLDAAGYALAAKRTTPPSAPVGVDEAMVERALAAYLRRQEDGESLYGCVTAALTAALAAKHQEQTT